MLKSVIYVVCEKVIIAQDTTPSLINLFNKITITPIRGPVPEIPSNAVAPREWAVFSMWENEPGDELKEYILCTRILYPDKSPFGDVSKSKINVEPKKRSQMYIQIQGFPIGQFGFYTVRTWVEEKGQTVVAPMDFTIELEKTPETKAV